MLFLWIIFFSVNVKQIEGNCWDYKSYS